LVLVGCDYGEFLLLLYNGEIVNNEAKIISIVGFFSLFIMVGGVWGLSKLTNSSENNAVGEKAENPEVSLGEDDHIIGQDGVLVVEYADFECPACAVAHMVNKQVISENEGKVRWVFKHFPLPFHKNAIRAAEAAEAASAQGKFWEMHDQLFENQSEWSELSDPVDVFVEFADELNLDKDRFVQDIKSGKFRAKIEKDQKEGESLGINATPTFVVGGKKYKGGMSIDQWRDLIVD